MPVMTTINHDHINEIFGCIETVFYASYTFCCFQTIHKRDENIKILKNTTIGIFSSFGGNPVFGSDGTTVEVFTTTVASAKSVAVRLLASPVAVPVFVVVCVRFVWQVKDHVSLFSNRLFLFRSPGCPKTRPGSPVHLLSVMLTLLNGTVPGFVTVYV